MSHRNLWWMLVVAIGVFAIPVAADDPVYSASVRFYQITDTTIDLLGPEDLDGPVNAQLETILDSPCTINFENTGISKIFESISDIYKLNFAVDNDIRATGNAPDPMVQYVNVKNVSLREALHAILTPLKLGFYIDGSVVRVRNASNLPPSSSASESRTRAYVPSRALTALTEGAIRVGSSVVNLAKGERGGLDAGPNIEFLAAPNIVLTANQKTQLSMSTPVQWLKPIPGSDGDYRLQHTAAQAGTKVDLLVKEATNDQLDCTLSMTVGGVRERRPAPGTILEVGEPVFDTTGGTALAKITLGQTAALLTQLGENSGGVLLVLFTIDRQKPRVAEQSATLPQYSLETRLIQVRGEPDWQWWMQPFARAYRLYEGAGRLLGPVDVTELRAADGEIDWRRHGFVSVKDSALLSSPRATNWLNRRALEKAGKLPIAPKVELSATPEAGVSPAGAGGGAVAGGDGRLANIREVIGPVYNDLALSPRVLSAEDLMGASIIVDMSEYFEPSPDSSAPLQAHYRGVMAIIEADTSTTPGEFRLQHTVLVNTLLNSKSKSGRQPGPQLHAELSCDYITRDGATAAFLIPVAADEYAVVLSTFNLIDPSGKRAGANK